MSEIKQYKTCPVCGHHNWCGYWHKSNSELPNATLHTCHYVEGSPQGEVLGADGKTYVLIKELKSRDGWILESKEQRDEERRLWAERNGNGWRRVTDPVRGHALLAKRDTMEQARREATVLPNEKLDVAYRCVMQQLTLLPEHRNKLLEDGWTDDMIKRYHVCSMPLPDKQRWVMEREHRKTSELVLPWRYQIVELLQKEVGEDLTGIPGFYLAKTADRSTGEVIERWRMAGPTGMMFFSKDVNGHYFGAQIRLDVVNSGGKYRGWSTNPEKTDKNGNQLYPHGTYLPVQPGFIYNPEKDDPCTVYITEGFKKGAIGNETLHVPFVHLPGVGNFAYVVNSYDERTNVAAYLRKIGTQTIVIAYDADKGVNSYVLKHEGNLAREMQEYGFRVQLASWNPAFGKGLDDLLKNGLRPLTEPYHEES